MRKHRIRNKLTDFDPENIFRVWVSLGTNRTAEMLEVEPWKVRYMARTQKWRRPAHMASIIYAGVIYDSADPSNYPGLDFDAQKSDPVGYELEFMEFINWNYGLKEIKEKATELGYTLGKDIQSMCDLKDKLQLKTHEQNSMELWFYDYMRTVMNGDDPREHGTSYEDAKLYGHPLDDDVTA